MMKPRGPSSCWYSSDMCNQARITRAVIALSAYGLLLEGKVYTTISSKLLLEDIITY